MSREFRIVGQDGMGQQPTSQAVNGLGTFRLSRMSTAPYVGRKGRCSAKNDTCNGFAIKGSTLCAGHARSGSKKKVSDDAAE